MQRKNARSNASSFIAAVTFTFLFAGTGFAAEDPPTGVVEMFELDGDFGTIKRLVSGVPRAVPNATAEAHDRWRAGAETFALAFAASRGANGTESFTLRRVYEDDLGQAHLRISQTIAGLPVAGSELIAHVDRRTGKVFGVNGRFAIDRGLAREPRMSADEAIAAATREYGLGTARVEGAPELTYIIDKHGNVRLAWSHFVSYFSENGAEMDRIYADAGNGIALARDPQIRRAKNRQVYDCHHQSASWNNCTQVLYEGCGFCWSQDTAVTSAWTNAGIVYDYFKVKHNRDGMNGSGIVFKQGVHYGDVGYGNAGWYPETTKIAAVYGDGAGSYSAPLSHSSDIVAHEYTHGVMRHEVNLSLGEEAPAIDEGFADIFAVAATGYGVGMSPDWKIAEDVFTKDIANDAMRYLNDPAKRTSPSHADTYPLRKATSDPHRNSGIVGLAFYLFSQGGFHPRRPSVSVTAWGSEAAERVFYRAMAAYMTSNTNFRKLRDYTEQAAVDLYGSLARWEIQAAWYAVGNYWGDTQTFPLSAGSTWISPQYTAPNVGNAHFTIHVVAPAGASYEVICEKWNGSSWTNVGSQTASGSVEFYAFASSGTNFRWRVNATGGSATYTAYWNYPRF